jgi:hypothetical protein
MGADRSISDKTVLEEFTEGFCRILEKHCKYIIVSGFVAIAHGRSRGTEDIDVIIERITKEKFGELFSDLEKGGFACVQPGKPGDVYNDYLLENTSIRFVKKGTFVPDMELKLAKDALDEYQLKNRKKLPLTGLDLYFSSIEANIAFKEDFLRSDKDLEDARHLRIIYAEELDETVIRKIKDMIKKAENEGQNAYRTRGELGEARKRDPRSEWIKEIKPLVDSQMIMANRFYARLAKEKDGAEKIRKIMGI